MPIRVTSVLNETVEDIIQSECSQAQDVVHEPQAHTMMQPCACGQARTAMWATRSLLQSLGPAMCRLAYQAGGTGRTMPLS